jgi:hypothetical protein
VVAATATVSDAIDAMVNPGHRHRLRQADRRSRVIWSMLPPCRRLAGTGRAGSWEDACRSRDVRKACADNDFGYGRRRLPACGHGRSRDGMFKSEHLADRGSDPNRVRLEPSQTRSESAQRGQTRTESDSK